jgi:hypothetical protein
MDIEPQFGRHICRLVTISVPLQQSRLVFQGLRVQEAESESESEVRGTARALGARRCRQGRQQMGDSERASPAGEALRIPRASLAGGLLLSDMKQNKRLPEGSLLF